MNVEMILAGARFVGMAISFTLLLRVHRLSVGLMPTESFYECLPASGGVNQSVEIDTIFRAQER